MVWAQSHLPRSMFITPVGAARKCNVRQVVGHKQDIAVSSVLGLPYPLLLHAALLTQPLKTLRSVHLDFSLLLPSRRAIVKSLWPGYAVLYYLPISRTRLINASSSWPCRVGFGPLSRTCWNSTGDWALRSGLSFSNNSAAAAWIRIRSPSKTYTSHNLVQSSKLNCRVKRLTKISFRHVSQSWPMVLGSPRCL